MIDPKPSHIPVQSITINTTQGTMQRLIWGKYKQHKLAVAGVAILLIIGLACIIGPEISPYNIKNSSLQTTYQAPSWAHPFGTDDLGRDQLTRLLYGGRISLSIGLISMLITIIIGVTIGSISGYFGGWIDNILMRITDIMLTIPRLFLLIITADIMRKADVPSLQKTGGVLTIIIVISLMSWMSIARLVRGAFLSLREKEFVEAAKTLGLTNLRIIIRHILPNAIGPVIVSTTLGLAGIIITESGLSYLGFGVQPPTPTWGNMLRNAQNEMLRGHLWLAIFPGLLIFIVVLSINYVGDGLRDALDPSHVQ